VNAVTAEQAAAAARAHYDPGNAFLIVVGDAKTFWNGVKAKRAGFERIGIDKLNLDSATLK
jgi:predicted Zn-dependent peptidase